MVPNLFHVRGIPVPTHDFFVALGAVTGIAVFWMELRRRGVRDERMWWLVLGALLTGAVFARISAGWRYLAGDPEPSLGGLWLYGGKSVLGGLAGAYFGVLLTKRIVGYREKTGDFFAPAATLAIAVGRVGCFLTEPIGTTTSFPWGIRLSESVAARVPSCPACLTGRPMHPAFLYEIMFLLALFAFLRWVRARVMVPGETFKVFLLAYGLFRFAVEFVRENPRFAFGLSGSQVFLAFTLPILIAYFARQVGRRAYATVEA